jgi:hypothetical protein
MSTRTQALDNALDQLRPRLDAYCDGQMGLEEITAWLSSYEAGVPERDAVWQEASRRIWALLSQVESGYGHKASIHQGLEAIARDCRQASD